MDVEAGIKGRLSDRHVTEAQSARWPVRVRLARDGSICLIQPGSRSLLTAPES